MGGEYMARLSPLKKEEIRRTILAVSSRMFTESGYDVTSTSKIAQEVGIAEGTLFNYFQSKAELYWVCITENYSLSMVTQPIDNEACLEELIYEMSVNYMDFFIKMPKKILKEIFGVTIEFAKKKPALFKKLVDMDYRYMDSIKELLIQFEDKGILVCDNINYLADALFGIFGLEVILYMYEESYEKSVMLHNLHDKTRFLLKPYMSKTTKKDQGGNGND